MSENLNSAWAVLRSVKALDFMRTREMPPSVIASVDAIIDAFDAGDAQERNRITRNVDKTFSFVFFMYARRASIEAVRRGQPGVLRRGLLALAIENLTFDWRDSMPQLVKLYHSAGKFPQVDVGDLFGTVATTSSAPFNQLLSGFIRGPEESNH